ncbi:hypothetical protein BMT54_11835, partial [Pasteurellaceae bacterium 15-036681]
ASIINDGQGGTYLSARNNMNFNALNVGFDEKMGGGNHYRNEAVNDVVVSAVKGAGNVTLSAKNIYAEGADFDAKGRLLALAENDIVLGTAKRSSDYEEFHHTKSSSAFGSSKKTTLDTNQQQTSIGTKLGGSEIIVSAGNDVTAKNLQAIADKDLLIKAGNNVSITADTNAFKTTHFEEKSKSGVFTGGGIGITFGKKSESHEQEAEGWQQSQARSTLGSLSGNITVSAGNHAHLSGVDAIASKELNREILIESKSTYVGASQDELSSKERHEQKQSGLTVAFSSAVTDGAMAVSQALNRSEKVQDERLGALLKVKAANEAYETVNKAKTLIDTLQNATNATEAMGNSDFKVSVSVGASKAVSTSHTQQTTHQGSELDAHHVTIRATEGDNTIVGSKINATKTELEGNNINLLATTDTQTNRSDNKNVGWSVGVFVGKSEGTTGFGVEGSVNVGKGYSNSDSKVQNNTEINSETLIIKAKETTTLKGAVANVDHLKLNTKNLHIESLQDSEKYDSKQTQAGVSAAVAWGSGGGASAQVSQNKANVDYAQVNQQSGFNINKTSDINVAENTHLKGGIINAQGEKENHSMKTGTLTTENVENRSDIKVSSVSAGASTDMSKMATSAMGAALSALGNMSESERSTTQSAISSNINLQITDSNAQQAKTGKTAEEMLQSLNRDTGNANQVLTKQDLAKAQERQEATQIVAEIGAKRVGDLAQQMGWKEGSPEKVALHGLVGYLSAKVGGGNATASTLSAMGSEYINTQIANYLAENTNLTPDQRNAIQQASAAGLGALIGAGLSGDSTTVKQSVQMALRTEQFNRQLHPDELQRIEELADGDKEKQRRLEIAACALVHCSAQIPADDPEYAEYYTIVKAREELGNTPEFANERALLSQQKANVDMTDAWTAERRPLFTYTVANAIGDKDDAGPRVVVRTTGLAQATGGVATAAFGTGLCQSGLGCVAGVPVAAYGMDNFVAGARTAYSGEYVSTVGAKAISQLTGLSESTSEFIYGAPSVVVGARPIIVGATKTTRKVVNEVARMGGEIKYVAGELGKDVKAVGGYATNVANKGMLTATDVISTGTEKSALAIRQFGNSLENTGTKKFALGAIGGGVGEIAVESRSYLEGKKEINAQNAITSANNVLKSSVAGGTTAGSSTLQALGINTLFGVTLKQQNIYDSFKENTISSGFSSSLGYRGITSEPLSGAANAIFTDEIKRRLSNLDTYKNNKDK